MVFYIILLIVFACGVFGMVFNRRNRKRFAERITKEYKGKQREEVLKKDEDMMMANFWFMISTFVAAISGVILLVNLLH
ncbi:MAG TPA: hypothetical protein PKD52_11160 [Clostridiales bacterium]|nr:hypothetical protein [Clostridiales bacterium]